MSKKTDEYEAVRAVWYQKLKEDGFKDIESNEENLKEWSMKRAMENPVEIWQAKAAYYNMATRFLNEYKFKNLREKIIWEYHTEGISCRSIAKLLATAKVKKTTYVNIHYIIKRLEEIMKKMYMIGYND